MCLFSVGMRNSHLVVLEQESMTLTVDDHDNGESGNANVNETSRNGMNDGLHGQSTL